MMNMPPAPMTDMQEGIFVFPPLICDGAGHMLRMTMSEEPTPA